jgi:hypothetical protein
VGTPQLAEDLTQAREGGVETAKPIAQWRESRGCRREGVLVQVQPDQTPVGRGSFEDRGGVSAAAERAIDDDRSTAKFQECQGFIEENRLVRERTGHRSGAPPAFAT